MANIIVCGADGRMGRTIIQLANADSDINVVGAVEIDSSPAIGMGKPIITKSSEMERIVNKGDIIVDFTVASNTIKNLEIAVKKGALMVIGTTGLNNEHKDILQNASKKIPIVTSPNMSIGINILIDLVENLAKKMSGYDVEIVELHHNKKKDAPSGTAIRLAEAAAKGMEKDLKKDGVYGRHGTDALRTPGEIGVHAVRGGDIVGEHTIYFIGIGERIEISHKASSRENLASGALKASKWIADKPAGLYDMRDVLGLK
ncbi:MAG: 4-hydroxy-tetrahydrodipicolinate reductase [Endomicrobiia bacterium]|jgi:4-hydroxy-tetrahydrodipicolinate reductase|nr:4-hydroxy-tetrahydrodipicolinate reductase [Endomicrobiaceae bacterium]MDD3052800.1 4-hydroxy-tetrahydrodipicolinate reductase [Endomicrobiaceae bacterium]MDD3921932.1 4-hydroxy-tetrahydrodipicolinate reductase [Endomicrobiaceae bacterium]MDD5101744.1 4-hydroxy-tetrahydrodipicolinate reductase [Endomicrobiaceae bacterium]